MTDIVIDVQDWAKKLGPGITLLAYYDLENRSPEYPNRRMDQWNDIVSGEGIYVTQTEGPAPGVRNWRARLYTSLSGRMTDMYTKVHWVANVSPTLAVLRWEASGTQPDGKKVSLNGINMYEADSEGRMRHQTGHMLFPPEQLRPQALANLAAYIGIPTEGKSTEQLQTEVVKELSDGS